jgi:hypothetical protein
MSDRDPRKSKEFLDAIDAISVIPGQTEKIQGAFERMMAAAERYLEAARRATGKSSQERADFDEAEKEFLARDREMQVILRESMQLIEQEKVFQVEGWGDARLANLWGFVAFDGYKQPVDLQVGEATEGRLQNTGSDKKPERITRIK